MDIREKGLLKIATPETQEDINLDVESEKSAIWKDQVSDMMKDLRKSIMVDVKELMNEIMIEFIEEIIASVKSNIIESMNTQKVINNYTNQTSNQ